MCKKKTNIKKRNEGSRKRMILETSLRESQPRWRLHSALRYAPANEYANEDTMLTEEGVTKMTQFLIAWLITR